MAGIMCVNVNGSAAPKRPDPGHQEVSPVTPEKPKPERKYALTRITAGDYLLPSNDRSTLWRIRRYTDGPSLGLEIPKDREFWGCWAWKGPVDGGVAIDPDAWERWEMVCDFCDTRQQAINDALRLSEDEAQGSDRP